MSPSALKWAARSTDPMCAAPAGGVGELVLCGIDRAMETLARASVRPLPQRVPGRRNYLPARRPVARCCPTMRRIPVGSGGSRDSKRRHALLLMAASGERPGSRRCGLLVALRFEGGTYTPFRGRHRRPLLFDGPQIADPSPCVGLEDPSDFFAELGQASWQVIPTPDFGGLEFGVQIKDRRRDRLRGCRFVLLADGIARRLDRLRRGAPLSRRFLDQFPCHVDFGTYRAAPRPCGRRLLRLT